MCEDYPELTLPLENTILVNVHHDDYKCMKTVCDKYNKAVENIKNLWKGTARPDQLRTRPSTSKYSVFNVSSTETDVIALFLTTLQVKTL